MDDIIVWGKSPEEHDERLKKCLARIDEANLTVNPNKCKFNVFSLNFFGFRISADGMLPIEANLKCLKVSKDPTNVAEVFRFLAWGRG